MSLFGNKTSEFCFLANHCEIPERSLLFTPPSALESEPPEVAPDIVSEDVKVVAITEKGGLHHPRADAAPEELLVGRVAVPFV